MQDANTSVVMCQWLVLKTIKHCYSFFLLQWLLEMSIEYCFLKHSLQAWSVQHRWCTWGRSRNVWAGLGHHLCSELNLLSQQSPPRTGHSQCLPTPSVKEHKTEAPRLVAVCFRIFLAKTFYIDGSVDLERDDFLGSSKRKLMYRFNDVSGMSLFL